MHKKWLEKYYINDFYKYKKLLYNLNVKMVEKKVLKTRF